MSTASSQVYLSHARYGKDKVRVFRIVREEKWHTIVEYNVTALLEGDINVRYDFASSAVIYSAQCIAVTLAVSLEDAVAI